MDGKQACVLMVRHPRNSAWNRINFADAVWKSDLCMLNISHTHKTKIPKSDILSERKVQKAFFWLRRWRLLTSMRSNNPRQKGSFCFYRCIYFDMPALFMESKCLEALMLSLAHAWSMSFNKVFVMACWWQMLSVKAPITFCRIACFKGKALAL